MSISGGSYNPKDLHYPHDAVNGWIWTIKTGGSIKQIFYRYGTLNTTSNYLYMRNYHNEESKWSDWTWIMTDYTTINYFQLLPAEPNSIADRLTAIWNEPNNSKACGCFFATSSDCPDGPHGSSGFVLFMLSRSDTSYIELIFVRFGIMVIGYMDIRDKILHWMQ